MVPLSTGAGSRSGAICRQDSAIPIRCPATGHANVHEPPTAGLGERLVYASPIPAMVPCRHSLRPNRYGWDTVCRTVDPSLGAPQDDPTPRIVEMPSSIADKVSWDGHTPSAMDGTSISSSRYLKAWRANGSRARSRTALEVLGWILMSLYSQISLPAARPVRLP